MQRLAATMEEVVAGTGDDVARLLVVGHEPTTSQTLAVLTGSAPVFPTSAVAVFEYDGKWSELDEASASLVAFHVGRA